MSQPPVRLDLVTEKTEQELPLTLFGDQDFLCQRLTDPDEAAIADEGAQLVIFAGWPLDDALAAGIARLHRRQPHAGIGLLLDNPTHAERLRCQAIGADLCLDASDPPAVIGATLRALVRRLWLTAGPPPSRWRLQVSTASLLSPAGAVIHLTPRELLLLYALAHAPDHMLSRRELVAAMGEDYLQFDDHRLDVCIARLRRKFAASGHCPLRTQRSRGYSFDAIIELCA